MKVHSMLKSMFALHLYFSRMYSPKYYQADEQTLRDIIIENNFGSLVTVTRYDNKKKKKKLIKKLQRKVRKKKGRIKLKY